MADYLHGAYGVISTAGTKVAAKSPNAIVYTAQRRCRRLRAARTM